MSYDRLAHIFMVIHTNENKTQTTICKDKRRKAHMAEPVFRVNKMGNCILFTLLFCQHLIAANII